jgi:phosphoesterase RecJ-like protein
MPATITDDQFRTAAQRIAAWRRPLILTHRRPDGDALGCVVAADRLLRGQQGDPAPLLFEPVPDRYRCLAPDLAPPDEDLARAVDAIAPDAVIILDTCSFAQLDPIADWLRDGGGSGLPKIALDHHVTRDPVADHYLIDETASAAALILFDWARAAGWTIDRETAQALFAGLATDTGWFRFSNTDARSLQAAASLIELGAVPHDLHEAIYNREPLPRIRIQAAALASLELSEDGRLAIMALTPESFRLADATAAHTEDLVNEPMRVDGVVVSVLLVVDETGVVRVSLRSKPPGPSVPDVNVAEVAAGLGGGGHARAAGVRITGSLETVRQQVLERLCPIG